jgi:molybdenum cofactor biosynthesis enzyme MoaA
MSSIDIEITNRCNAKCHFCPRDATPHQGLMTREVFDQSLVRAIEYRDLATPALGFEPGISLCGLGEPLLHRDAAAFTRDVRDAGFRCSMSSNGALLDARRGEALLDAGLQQIYINVGDRDEAYEDVYKLPFEKTRDNVAQFVEMAGDTPPRCATTGRPTASPCSRSSTSSTAVGRCSSITCSSRPFRSWVRRTPCSRA